MLHNQLIQVTISSVTHAYSAIVNNAPLCIKSAKFDIGIEEMLGNYLILKQYLIFQSIFDGY